MKWAFTFCHPEVKSTVRNNRYAKRLAHRNQRHQPIELDGIEPLNIIVKGETNIVAQRKRDRATKVEVAQNVFDIRYVAS